jgi:hypothetical protein
MTTMASIGLLQAIYRRRPQESRLENDINQKNFTLQG